ncbi:hypothetical protein PV371_08810 [Streptomyces sp. TX20-6-3]|uniref:hypothetical protein n=1 Tax=Streptomyces sp. TX20-6-3 TaxID=3028705 RepID=UPI0029BBEF2B|nr:hypothetical protein [Streptomyces sp. TX20-6-3]MDX2559747.1 hypothetical protein [Streptomyces sp. TX20-6-3]
MRTALRTAITTALVAGVALTPVVAAGTAFAADGPGAAPAATSPASSGVRSADVKPSDEVPAEGGTDTSDASDAADASDAVKPEKGAQTPEAGTAAASAKGTLVRTETLMTGTVAKIYKVNAQNHRAELFREGHPVGVLEAITRSVAGQDNGEFFVLNPDGTTHNWTGNIAGPETGTYKLADGTVLQLGKKDGRFGLQLIENGKGRGYTYVTGVRTVWTFGRAVVVLEQDGQFAAYIPGASKQGAPRPVATGGTQTEPGTGGSAVVLGACTVSRTVDIGAGTKAELFMTRQGPLAEFSTADDNGEDQVFAMVDRAHPSLPKSVGIVGRIIDPKSATPSLFTQVEGGPGAKGATHAFPRLPKGCAFETAPGGTSNGTTDTGTDTGSGNGTGTGVTTNTGQTSVIPKGAVAAGAELGTEGDGTALLAAGAGASLAAAGLGFVVLRRRSAAARV